MSKLVEPRDGELLEVKQQQQEFSFWSMKKGAARFGLQPRRIFVSEPWGIIKHYIETNCTSTSKSAALAFCEQAEDYFKAAKVSGIVAAKPVLLYYCMLNIAKAFVLVKNVRPLYDDKAHHGLAERIILGGEDFTDSCLNAYPSGKKVNVFDDFYKALNGGVGLSSIFPYEIMKLVPQILHGHRLWCSSFNNKERFIPIYKINLMEDIGTKTLWLDILIYKDELSTKGISRRRFLEESLLDFHEVKCCEEVNGRKLLCFEQNNIMHYNHRSSDEVHNLVSTIKKNLWISVLSVPPYRKYYTYLCPITEVDNRLPQLASIYAVFYYFGSVTRYRPYSFEKILSKEYGGFIREIIETAPNQFLYLLASDLCEQEIAKASII